jgi:hypothetical protein
MYQLFNTPAWFNGWDLVFDGIGLLVALFIAMYSWRIYKINKENRFGYFAFAFILVTLGFLFKIFTSGVVYYTPVRDTVLNVLRPAVGEHLSLTYLYYRAGFFLQMIALLGAWLLIFFVSQKPRQRLQRFDEVTQIALYIYFVFLISVVSNFEYYVFYLTSSVLLGLIILNYYKNYLNTNKNKKAYLVMLSFLFVLIGNLFFIFVFLFKDLYVIGEMFQLIGFLILLYTYHKIIKR